MKKLLLSLALAFVGLCANAQFIFVDKAGNEVKDGSVVIVTEVEEDVLTGGLLMHSGLYVKNTGEEDAYAGMQFDITRMDNGSFQHCFPGNCAFYEQTGLVVRDGAGKIEAGKRADIFSEWAPKEEGLCTVVYTIRVMAPGFGTTYNEVSKGPSVTVHYCNGVYPANISSLLGNNDAKSYNLQGQIVDNNFRGVVIRNGKKYIQ